jgi:deoxycytidine triphosphate deaminase
MKILTDSEIEAALNAKPPAILNFETSPKLESGSKLQPASVDLSIGDICLPSPEAVCEDHIAHKRSHTLGVGECVRVFTKERINFTGDHAKLMALVFAPARVSRRGVFVMDTGVVDPGFDGVLGFTLINFGSTPFDLNAGETIATAIVIEVSGSIAVPYHQKIGKKPYAGRLEAVGKLSRDFLNILSSARSAARQATEETTKELERRYFKNIVLPMLATIVVTFIIAYFSAYSVFADKMFDLTERVTKLESKK